MLSLLEALQVASLLILDDGMDSFDFDESGQPVDNTRHDAGALRGVTETSKRVSGVHAGVFSRQSREKACACSDG